MGVSELYQSPCKHIQRHKECRRQPICCCIDQQGTVKEQSLSCWFDSNDQLGSLYSSSQNPSCKNHLDKQLARLLCLDRKSRLDKEYRPTKKKGHLLQRNRTPFTATSLIIASKFARSLVDSPDVRMKQFTIREQYGLKSSIPCNIDFFRSNSLHNSRTILPSLVCWLSTFL